MTDARPEPTAWDVFVAASPEKRIARIPSPDKDRLLAAIDALRSGPCGDIAPLRGRPEWRLRVGGWRILLTIETQARRIIVRHVAARGDAYKG
ncbi:MAG: hypothetical protein IJR14_07515 [Synergistaceae bacterium]|nr:hypothetical protein [Synergistaceae bacterium]